MRILTPVTRFSGADAAPEAAVARFDVFSDSLPSVETSFDENRKAAADEVPLFERGCTGESLVKPNP